MSTDPRELIRRLFRDVDLGRDDFVDEYYHPDYQDHAPSRTRARRAGLDGVREAFAVFRRAFPDVRHELHHVLADGDKVVVHLTAWGTHLGELFGIPPTGRQIAQTGIAIYGLRDGRIIERWAQSDSEILDLLGVPPGAERSTPHDREIEHQERMKRES